MQDSKWQQTTSMARSAEMQGFVACKAWVYSLARIRLYFKNSKLLIVARCPVGLEDFPVVEQASWREHMVESAPCIWAGRQRIHHWTERRRWCTFNSLPKLSDQAFDMVVKPEAS